MKRFNVILLLDAAGGSVLMCRRAKQPYEGLYNLVGGKIEQGEDGLHSAYRELREETGVTAADVSLRYLMTFCYPGVELQVYAGRLRHDVELTAEADPLAWIPLTEDFFDMDRFAGDGNIGHMVATAQRNYPETLQARELTLTLVPLAEEDLPVLAYQQRTTVEALAPMLAGSLARTHEGRYYEQFAIRVDGCMVGLASLYAHEDGTVSDGMEVFAPFRRCAFASQAMPLLMEKARQAGYRTMTAQVRTDNDASLALHQRAGFAVERTFVNRRGNEVHALRCPLYAQHEMSLRPKPFAKIASGEKRYELRLHDEKRRQIRVGDEILFTCTEDGRTALTRVTELRPFPDFAVLYASLPLTECGYTPHNVHRADPKDMEAYYPPEKQAEHGVLAIGVARVRYPVVALTGLFEVRELTAADVPEMLRLAQGNPLYYEYMRIAPNAENIEETLTALPPRRSMADKHFIGWFEGDRLIAMMDLIARHPQEDMAFIGWFMVEAERQGVGLGRRIVGDVLLMLRSCGVREVRLGRVEGNPQSERFWRACGFADNGLGYDTDAYHVAVMAKRLD